MPHNTSTSGLSCAGPNPDMRTPRLRAPKGTTDTHVHVFGPQERYPYVSPRRYTPPDCAPSHYAALARAMGVERVVLVQPSICGTDNSCQLDAVAQIGMPARVVVVVSPDISDAELDRMHGLGARAVRFILSQPGGVDQSSLERMGERLHEIGWHIELMLLPEQLVELEPRIARLRCRTELDHMGGVLAKGGLQQPAFAALKRLVSAGSWTKISAGYRLSTQPAPFRDLIPFVQELVRARPDRLLWATDWPQSFFDGDMPSSPDLMDLLLDWVPDEATRERILVRNPAELYGF